MNTIHWMEGYHSTLEEVETEGWTDGEVILAFNSLKRMPSFMRTPTLLRGRIAALREIMDRRGITDRLLERALSTWTPR